MGAFNNQRPEKGIPPLMGALFLFVAIAASAYFYFQRSAPQVEIAHNETASRSPSSESVASAQLEKVQIAPIEKHDAVKSLDLQNPEVVQEVLPQPQPSRDPILSGAPLWYRVKKGENLSKILTRFGLCADYRTPECKSIEAATKSLNQNLTQNTQLSLNEKLNLPITELPEQALQKGYQVSDDLEIVLQKIEQNEVAKALPKKSEPKREPATESVPAPTPVATTAQPEASKAPESTQTEPVKNENEGDDFEVYSELYFIPDFRYYRVDGKQSSNSTTATLLSSLSPGVFAHWKQVWSEGFRSFLGLGVAQAKIESSSSRTITGASQTLTGIRAGAEYDWTQNFHSSFLLGTHDELFYWAPSAAVLEVQKASIPRLSAGGSYDFYHRQSLLLFVGFDGLFLMPAKKDDYDIRAGYGYAISIGVLQTAKPGSKVTRLKGELYFESQTQNTSIIDRNQKIMGLRFGLDWDFWR